MRYGFAVLIASILLPCVPCLGQSEDDGFVLVKGGEFRLGRGTEGARVRLEDFEILDHPVTNAEYKAFVDASGHPAPLHWEGGKIPAGKDEHPVIFVNRTDVDAYLRWRTGKEGRIYRLPTTVEFEVAARSGLAGKSYPWGDEEPGERANYDAQGERPFDQWQDYLQPARWGSKNGYGLYGMAGNVWQMTVDNHDPATVRYKYRITDLAEIENAVMGGSWARGPSYLVCGRRLGISSGIRHPDLGFRPVRQPKGSDWGLQARRLAAVSLGDGRVFVAGLCSDRTAARRGSTSTGLKAEITTGFRVNGEPVVESTTFLDSGLKGERRYQYYVRPVDSTGAEGRRSEWAGVTVTAEASQLSSSLSRCARRARWCPSSATSMATGRSTASSGSTTATARCRRTRACPCNWRRSPPTAGRCGERTSAGTTTATAAPTTSPSTSGTWTATANRRSSPGFRSGTRCSSPSSTA